MALAGEVGVDVGLGPAVWSDVDGSKEALVDLSSGFGSGQLVALADVLHWDLRAAAMLVPIYSVVMFVLARSFRLW